MQAKASITCLTWTPEGRRCISGSQRGEFTLWGGTNFNYEAALQARQAASNRIYPRGLVGGVLGCAVVSTTAYMHGLRIKH